MTQFAAIEPNIDEVAEGQCPPGNLWSDEPPLDSDFHCDQIDLLIRILRPGGAIAPKITDLHKS